MGRGCLMAKADIKSAYRILPISPQSYHLLGFSWENQWWVDKSLPMGLSLAANRFELFSTAIQWILKNKLQVKYMSHILDDFLFFGHPGTTECSRSLDAFMQLSKSLNIPIKGEKTVLPTNMAQLHGLTVDTVNMLVILPPDKQQKCIDMLNTLSHRKTATLNELQSLIGTLQFATKAIIGGRTFLRRLTDLTKGVFNKNHHIRLNNEARRDMAMWLSFLVEFNGKTIISKHYWVNSFNLKFYSDASGAGYAGVNGEHWFQGEFPPEWKSVNIAVKELLPVALSFRMWAPRLKGNNIIFMVDNKAIVDVLQSQTSKDPHIMSILRPMVVASMVNNVQFYSYHIPGKHNTIADLLSRFQISKAKLIAPWLASSPTQVPPHWLPW